MKILHLTLKRKWFDMIASGEKKEEYREIKPYWIRRLFAWNNAYDPPRDFHAVQFRNGYCKNAPTVLVEWKDTVTGPAKPEWSDNWQGDVFIIKLGEILKTENINQ